MEPRPQKRKRPGSEPSQPPPLENAPSSAPAQTGESNTSRRARTRPNTEARILATFYLPLSLVEQLDRAWVRRRLNDRKVQKSHLVTEALEAYLRDDEATTSG